MPPEGCLPPAAARGRIATLQARRGRWRVGSPLVLPETRTESRARGSHDKHGAPEKMTKPTIGVDISKDHLDACRWPGGDTCRVTNDAGRAPAAHSLDRRGRRLRGLRGDRRLSRRLREGAAPRRCPRFEAEPGPGPALRRGDRHPRQDRSGRRPADRPHGRDDRAGAAGAEAGGPRRAARAPARPHRAHARAHRGEEPRRPAHARAAEAPARDPPAADRARADRDRRRDRRPRRLGRGPGAQGRDPLQHSGVSMVTAAAILAEMPELGTLEAATAASLTGLAPFTRESGSGRARRRSAAAAATCAGRSTCRPSRRRASTRTSRPSTTASAPRASPPSSPSSR